jgi:hypothetical protein
MLRICATAALLMWLGKPALSGITGGSVQSARSQQVVWFDDMEGDVSEWRSVDFTVGATSRFHWDSYMAFGGTGQSWWCGTFDYDADGGYGNMWDERLHLQPVDLTTNTYPVLTFAYRHDSQVAYDYTYLEAKANGEYEELESYEGRQDWFDIGTYGFLLWDYDHDPFEARFRFVSNGWWSDEDGYYQSVGGAFACDNIKIYDYVTGTVHFYDSEPDMPGEDECVPFVPESVGDYWHLIDRRCAAYSNPHSWWCGDDADTGLIPPNLENGLYSPIVDLSGYGTVVACTVHFAIHLAIPMYCGDYCQYFVTCNGTNYYSMGRFSWWGGEWWGDFWSCSGWASRSYWGYDVSAWCPEDEITQVGLLWVMNTDDDGCGPAGAGDAGAMIDDVWIEVEMLNPIERASWGAIKAMFR